MNALIAEARKKYHKELLSSGVMTIDSKGIPSNACLLYTSDAADE